jgi:hypothetical protein
MISNAARRPRSAKRQRAGRPGASTSRAGTFRALVTELARREDWRAAVEELRLPDRDARALCVAVLRRRAFGRSPVRDGRYGS